MDNVDHASHRSVRAALGILYAEDFGQVSHVLPKPASSPKPPTPQPPPGITQSDVDSACIKAVQAAQIAWAASAAERRTEALAAIAAALGEARVEAAHQAETIADGLARTVLAMLAALFPHLCRAHGDAEIRAVVARLSPLLARHGTLVLRVHPGLIETLARDIDELDDSLAIELRPANLQPGDIRMSWADGALTRDTTAIAAALHDVLDRLGLGPPHDPPHPASPPAPTPATPTESLAHAQ